MQKLLFLLMALLLCTYKSNAQTKKITGTVTDQKSGESLIGVVIELKGAKTLVTTDNIGKYSIQVPISGNQVLVFRYLGYKSKEIATDGKQVIDVAIESSVTQLQEVVAIGYGSVNRRDLTGAVSSITEKQLRDVPVNSAAQALSGRLAGVQVTAAEGSPDASVKIRIRGGGSITQDNSPLYVIDGIQVEDGLSALSPQDIETIDILKDASTTAIYGARGANGVVIITTKGGKDKTVTVNYNGFVGVNQLANKLEVMKPYDFINYQYERSRGSVRDSTNFAQTYGANFADLTSFRNTDFIDWQDQVMGNDALMQTHNASINGGSKSTRFNATYTKNIQKGVMVNSGFNRDIFGLKLDHTLNDRFRFGANVRYNSQVTNGAGVSNPGAGSYNGLRHIVKYRPFNIGNISMDELDPEYFTETSVGNGLGIINPYVLAYSQFRENKTTITNLSGYANYTFNPFLSFRSTLGIDYNAIIQRMFDDGVTPIGQANGALPLAGLNNINNRTFNFSNVITYSNAKSQSSFKKRNEITALLGTEVYTFSRKGIDSRFRSFPSGLSAENALSQLSLGQIVPTYPLVASIASSTLSFFSRVNYTFDKKYLFTFNYRADGSSKFAPGKNWGFFPSGAVAWRISEESFLKNVKAISDLKLRLSYGLSGNNRIDDYQFQTIYNANALYALNGDLSVIGLSSPYLANPNLIWETTVARNAGIDLSLLKGKIQLTVDAYSNNTKDLLLRSPISFSSGYNIQLLNKGETRNTGLEFQVNASILDQKEFQWSANFNIGTNKNTIVRLSDNQQLYYQNSGWGISGQPADYIVKVGASVGSIFGYQSDGFYGVNDFNYDPVTSRYTLKAGVVSSAGVIGAPVPGSMKFKDVDGNGVLNTLDKTILGSAIPKFTGGLNQQFSYKRFDMSVFFNFSYGNKVLNANKLEFTSGYTPNTNLLAVMNSRWKTIDENGNVLQRTISVNGTNIAVGAPPEILGQLNKDATLWSPNKDAAGFFPTSWAVEDASFIRLNNVTVGYTFNPSFLKKFKGKLLRVYATGNNLAIITKYTGYDPEVDTRRGNPVTPGVDYSAYPRSRTFLLGVNLSL